MDTHIKITDSTDKEKESIIASLVAFNQAAVPSTQEPKEISLGYTAKNEKGEIIGGIIARMYYWKVIYVAILWVKEEYRHQGLGSVLLKKIESYAIKNDCSLIHLDTFDFQAKDFYVKQGYEIYGVLDDCPPDHQRFYLKKKMST